VKKAFLEYYARSQLPKRSIISTDKREFGFASFDGKMLRHKSFENEDELASFLKNFVPRDAYVSCAFYEFPEAEMDKKNWLGADLIFDIDADHIPTTCDKTHDEWRCNKCGFAGRGLTPEKCPVCENEKFATTTWPCETCLASAKEQMVRLVDMLMDDFGLAENEIGLFFSGHRGYHIHVENRALESLDADARREVIDYVCGFGDIDSTLFHERSTRRADRAGRFGGKCAGWRHRAVKYVSKFIEKATEEDFKSLRLRKTAIDTIIKNREKILGKLNDKSVLDLGILGVGSKSWNTILEFCVKSGNASVDTVVTTDIHRLIRLTGSLHGKTGFRKTKFPVSRIDDFDPLKEAIAFKEGDVRVFISRAPKLRVADEVFGPYNNQETELPIAAAMLLVCKGVAEVID
jgi:DNA primase small subunit